MRKRKNYLDELISEMNKVAENKDFSAMSEIYAEIGGLNGIEQNKIHIYFSEMNKDFSIRLPYKVKELKNKIRIGVFIYEKSKCFEIYFSYLDLENWQKNFIENDISAYYDETRVLSEDRIVLNKKICNSLSLYIGDIVKIEMSDSVIISKFDVENCVFC